MSQRQYKSGAQKRKEKAQHEKGTVKGQQSLSRFLQTPSQPQTDCLQDTALCEPPSTSIQAAAPGPSSTTLKTAAPSQQSTFDIGSPYFNVDIDIKKSHEKLPRSFPLDSTGHILPSIIFEKKLANGERVSRDWLVWSRSKEALFCLPCRIFGQDQHKRSALVSPEGWSARRKWVKLRNRVPEHEKSEFHKKCYVQWKLEQKKSQAQTSLSDQLFKCLQHEQEVWRGLLRRLLDVTLFLAERGLAFRGESTRIGDPSNGNFLGVLELLGKYDPLLNDHLRKVRLSQELNTKLQVHYLSPEIQNEFIDLCATTVRNFILEEMKSAKYYSLIVDATPDTAHVEQTVFLIRYVVCCAEEEDRTGDKEFVIHERFLTFVDCAQKTGEAIFQLIKKTLASYSISLLDCRGQGYDNGSNMKGAYKGVQAKMLEENNLAVYSACACHTLNLCGEQAAACCSAAVTFFGVVQKLYNLFCSSPQRWEILQRKIGCSLHSISDTRWSARIESVRPIAAHLPGVLEALDEVSLLNLSAECHRDVDGLKTYVKTFDCLMMASIWVKVLKAIDIVNKVIQARGATIEEVCKNLEGLLSGLQSLRNEGWERLWTEASTVAKNIGWPEQLAGDGKRVKKRKRMADEEEDNNVTQTAEVTYKREVFYVILDEIIVDLNVRFKSQKELLTFFSVLWNFLQITEDEIVREASNLVRKYGCDLQLDLVDELLNLKAIYVANFGIKAVRPLDLLNALQKMNLINLFPNVCVALRIYLTIPATVASAERAFSALSRVKNVLRSTMTQQRISSLGLLTVEAPLARKINMEATISDFAARKARRCNI